MHLVSSDTLRPKGGLPIPDTLGVSSKDPVLALRYHSSDLFAGGSVAVANHVANFAEKVDLFSVLGEHESYRDFIGSKLHERIRGLQFTP